MPQHLQRLNISTQHITVEFSYKSLPTFSKIYFTALLLPKFFSYMRSKALQVFISIFFQSVLILHFSRGSKFM